jgi:hypothetical protein
VTDEEFGRWYADQYGFRPIKGGFGRVCDWSYPPKFPDWLRRELEKRIGYDHEPESYAVLGQFIREIQSAILGETKEG